MLAKGTERASNNRNKHGRVESSGKVKATSLYRKKEW
jgi:hypothetical protein